MMLNKKREVIIFNQSKIGWVQINVDFFKKNLNLNNINYLALLEEDGIIEDFTINESICLNEIYKSISLYNVCIYNICNELGVFKNEISLETDILVIKKWYYIAKKTIDRLEQIFEDYVVKGVIVFHGHLLFDACLLEISKIHNIRYFSLEVTSNKERIVWDNVSGFVVSYNLSKNYFAKFEHSLTDSIVNSYCNNYLNEIHSYKRLEHSSNKECLDLPFLEPYILFVSQVYNDASQLFTLNNEFNNPVDIIKKSNLISKELGFKFVVKLHPKEINGKDPVMHRTYAEPTFSRIYSIRDSNNVYIDRNNEYDTYKLIKSAAIVITVNSQAGLEACLFNKPVLSYFKGFYSGLGFTYDYSNSYELENAMKYTIANNLIENRNLSKARSFFYIFYEIYCIKRSEYSLLNKVVEVFEINIEAKNKLFLFIEKVEHKIKTKLIRRINNKLKSFIIGKPKRNNLS